VGGGIAPHILELDTRPHGKSLWYSLDRRQGGPQSRSGRVEDINSHPLPRLEPMIIQPVAQLYRLLVNKSHLN